MQIAEPELWVRYRSDDDLTVKGSIVQISTSKESRFRFSGRADRIVQYHEMLEDLTRIWGQKKPPEC